MRRFCAKGALASGEESYKLKFILFVGLGCSQAVRQGPLKPPYEGSIPSSPAQTVRHPDPRRDMRRFEPYPGNNEKKSSVVSYSNPAFGAG